MNKKNLSEINTAKYKVKLRTQIKTSLSKVNCPLEIWDKYSKKTTYQVVQLIPMEDELNLDENL
jgi:hypothetical protein